MAEFVTIAENIEKADVLVVPVVKNGKAFWERIGKVYGAKNGKIFPGGR